MGDGLPPTTTPRGTPEEEHHTVHPYPRVPCTGPDSKIWKFDPVFWAG